MFPEVSHPQALLGFLVSISWKFQFTKVVSEFVINEIQKVKLPQWYSVTHAADLFGEIQQNLVLRANKSLSWTSSFTVIYLACLRKLVTSVTSFIFLPAVSPSAAVLIATHSVPDRLYCLQVLNCSRWKGENSGGYCNCDVGKHEVTWTLFTVFICASFVSKLCLQSQ